MNINPIDYLPVSSGEVVQVIGIYNTNQATSFYSDLKDRGIEVVNCAEFDCGNKVLLLVNAKNISLSILKLKYDYIIIDNFSRLTKVQYIYYLILVFFYTFSHNPLFLINNKYASYAISVFPGRIRKILMISLFRYLIFNLKNILNIIMSIDKCTSIIISAKK